MRKFTKKQTAIMRTLVEGHKDENGVIYDWLDVDELLDQLPYKTNKASLQFSIRSLVGHGMLDKGPRVIRRDRSRRTLIPSNKAMLLFGRKAVVKVMESGDDIEEFSPDMD